MKWPLVKFDFLRATTRNSFVGGPFGSNLITSDYVDEGVPVIRGANLPFDQLFRDNDFVFVSEDKAARLASNCAFPDDIIFTQRGTLGQVGLIPKDSNFPRYVISQSQMKLTVNPLKACPKFIYYFFRHPETKQKVINSAITSGVPHINLGILRDFDVPLPPLDSQNRIVDVLSAYDDLIENNRRRMALLEESARLLYREWFVYLHFPGYTRTRVTDGVPKGWELLELDKLAEIVMGQSPESKFYNETGNGLPFHQGVADFGDRFVSNRIFTSEQTRVAEANSILCSVRAPVGRLNITLEKIAIGRGLAALNSRTGHQSLLMYQLRNHFFKEDLIGSGSIFASVAKKELFGQKLLTPPRQLADHFEALSQPIDNQLRVLYLQNHKLRAARDLLLPRLMSGEIAP